MPRGVHDTDRGSEAVPRQPKKGASSAYLPDAFPCGGYSSDLHHHMVLKKGAGSPVQADSDRNLLETGNTHTHALSKSTSIQAAHCSRYGSAKDTPEDSSFSLVCPGPTQMS